MKIRDGPMDSQDIVAWGRIVPEWTGSERKRLQDLCMWGQQFSLDGFVRMEEDFEIMLCDFTEGVQVASFLNLVSHGRGPGGPPRRPPGRNPFPPSNVSSMGWDTVVQSSSWHNRYPGDTRIHLDLSRLISFYDTSLVPSLIPHRFNQERWDYRIAGISDKDIKAVLSSLESELRKPQGGSSGIDWMTLIHVIVDRYAERLDMVRYLLNSTEHDTPTTTKLVYAQVEIMLQPYILHSLSPSAGQDDYSWAAPIFRLCTTTHTSYIEVPLLSARLTYSERLIFQALSETNREICRVVTRMWVQGISAGLEKYSSPVSPFGSLLESWKHDINVLMDWLDWNVWVMCRPACAFEEHCYLPTWPFFGPRKDWERPQPRCIRKVEPL